MSTSDFDGARSCFNEIANHTDMTTAPDGWNMANGLALLAQGLRDLAQRIDRIENQLSYLEKR